MASHAHRFGEILRQAREKANQTAEVMAIILSMEPSDYLAIEAGLRFPDDDTVRRLCMMMEWNYLETQRLIRNEMSSPGRLTAAPVPSSRQGESGNGGRGESSGVPSPRAESLGGRLREVRQYTGQSADIIAALLHITPDQYGRLENGETPSDDLLRRVSMVYGWNFNELVSLMRAEQAHNLQPRLQGNPFPGTGQRFERLKNICRQIEAQFGALPDGEQDVVLAQLDLIGATLARHRPKAGMAAALDDATGKGRRRPGTALPPIGVEDRKLFS